MVRKSHGPRRKTRKLFKKHPRERGLPPISRLLYEYKVGEYVVIKIDPSVHKGQPHRRFHGKVGVVIGKRGRAYIIRVRDGDTHKTVFARPEHLMPFKG